MVPLARFSLALLSLALMFPTTSAGAAVTWEFSGVVTFVDQGVLVEPVPVGTPFSGTLTFDLEAPDQGPEPYRGYYPQSSPPGEFRVSVGSYIFRTRPGSVYIPPAGIPPVSVGIYNDRDPNIPAQPLPGHDEFLVVSFDNVATGSFSTGPNTEQLVIFDWQLVSLADPLSSTALFPEPPRLSAWGSRNVLEIAAEKGVFGGPPYFTIRGTVNQIVPEPGTASLVVVGTGLAFAAARGGGAKAIAL